MGRAVPDVHICTLPTLRVTGPNFTKFLHGIEASFMLLMRTRR